MPPRSPLAPLTHTDPERLGEHRLLARLGSGGMGTVYLARSAAGRVVALKTVHARIAADASFRSRFRLEADAARVIGDRYGARVFGADPLAGTPWLATEYVIGPQLDEAVRLGGPLPEPAVRELGADLARALGQLHRSEVVHRDLKPSNILITATGPKVIDFGIARALGDERLTRVGSAAGTPAFMSPEQAGGLEHTPAGDVFALAGVLVFAASGHAPFGGGQAADLLYRVRYAEPDLTGVPEGLAPLLARCLDKDPARRPPTAELARWLAPSGDGAFADGLPGPVLADIARRAAAVWEQPPPRLPAPAADPAGPASAEPRPGISRRRLLTLTAAGFTATAAAAGGAVWAWPDGKRSAAAAPQDPPAPLWIFGGRNPGRAGSPVRVGPHLVAAAGVGTSVIDPATGRSLADPHIASSGRLTTDGKVLYGLRTWTTGVKDLAVLAFPQEYDGDRPPVVTLAGFDAAEDLNDLLCAAGGTAVLYAKSASDGRWFLVAASLASGRELWRRPAPAPTGLDSAAVCVKPVKGGLLSCLRTGPSDTLALSLHDPVSGAERWQRSLPVPGAVPYQLATDENHVYLGADTLQALRLSDGAPAWSFGQGRDMGPKPYGQRRYGVPAVRDGVVYANEGARGLVAVDALTGAERWSEIPLKDFRAAPDTTPAVGARYVYAMDMTGLRAVDLRTHRPAWRYPTPATTLTPDPDNTRLYAREESRMLAFPME
ncbi:protein kinase domain-containing protein [Streptomyces goshikiensis]|uniref:serine/threonine-protein kinase n=1 Tax=Streptomyces goshikiensis TaxID=1942 RepID=UPI001672536B|nr:serine/threonine-protein kinase [Streptomyces goshikiensis]GHD60594.1 hypothetical protein GCM10010336_12730 [Streptomyces goshikiensis]